MTCWSRCYHASPTTLSDSQWLQASLPDRFCGFGISQVTSLTLHIFLASVVSTLLLQNEIVGVLQRLPDELMESLKCHWVALDRPPPSDQSVTKQASSDRQSLLADSTTVEEARTLPFQDTNLLVRATHSGDWITICGLWLSDRLCA